MPKNEGARANFPAYPELPQIGHLIIGAPGRTYTGEGNGTPVDMVACRGPLVKREAQYEN